MLYSYPHKIEKRKQDTINEDVENEITGYEDTYLVDTEKNEGEIDDKNTLE